MAAQTPCSDSIFCAAIVLASDSERAAYIAQACGEDEEMRAQVEKLVDAHFRAGSFLESPADVGATVDSQPPAAEEDIAGQWHAEAPRPRPVAPRPGTVIGPYKLVQEIGEGGMGTVFLAQQTEPVKRLVALKVIKPGMDSRQVIARFEAERQALALMDHPNIAKVLDAGATESGRPYFVMELVKGVPITRYSDEHHLTPRQRLELMVPVCQAVQHAHQKGIIHRDLKPSNVLVASYDGKPVPKVIDFGVAKAAGQQLTEHTLVTGFGTVVGTLEYMSPEQAEFNQLDIDTRSDVYSLGVLLYELLTGTTPLEKKRLKEAAMLEVLRLIREEEPPRPSTRLSTVEGLPSIAANRGLEPKKLSGVVRGELDWIVMKALEKDRVRRYETANGLASDLQRYLADEPVQACPPSAGYRLRKFARRNKSWVAAAALVAAVLILAAAVSAALAVRAWEAEGVARGEWSRAEVQTVLANTRAEDLAWRLYIHRVNLGHREAVAGNVAQADALLDACEPARRGWEWAFTKRLCHLEAMTLGGFADHAAAVTAARSSPPRGAASGPDADADPWTIGLMRAGGSVRGVAFSPDGKQFATAHDDGTVVLWDARTGREVRSLVGHTASASCVSFDETGGRVISGGFDRTVRVWDAGTGEQKLVLRGHTRPVLSVAFRPGADQAASSVHGALETFRGRGFEIKQWDLAAGGEVRTLYHRQGWSFTQVAFSADGRRLLSTSVWGGYLRVWDPDSGKELEARGAGEHCAGLAVSRTDGRLAFGRAGNSVWLTAPRLGPVNRTLAGHTGIVLATAFSPDGTRLASAGEDGAVKVWSVPDGREVMHFRGHTGAVTAVAFGRDGKTLASGSEDGTAKVWELPPARDPFPMNFGVWVLQAHFSPDGRRIAVGRFGSASVMDTGTNRTMFHLAQTADHLAYSRDGRLLATCAFHSDRVSVWDAETGRTVATWRGHVGHLQGVAFGPGSLLASAGDDGTVRLWDAGTARPGAVLRAHEGGAFGVRFDPGGTVLATIGWDAVVRLWEVPTGRPLRALGEAAGRLSPYVTDVLAFAPDGRRLAAACGDGTARVWEVATGEELHRLRGHTRAVTGVSYSPDGRRIVTGSEDHTIKLWDAATGDEVFTLRGHTGLVLGLAFSPDGKRLLSTSADGTVRDWDSSPRPRAPR